jgi:hypothetical protein
MEARDLVQRMDARLYRSRISVSAIIPGEADPVRGTFTAKPHEVEFSDGSFISLDIGFRCQITNAIRALAENDEVKILGTRYRLIRRIPDEGDESGHVILSLGTAAP